MDSPVALAELARLIEDRRDGDRPFVVGITGSVAVGKSTLAARLAETITAGAPTVSTAVVSSDSFLLPNAVLADRGLVMQKGYPASFDLDALGSFLRRVRAGANDLVVPVYDHFTYDIVDGATHAQVALTWSALLRLAETRVQLERGRVIVLDHAGLAKIVAG